MKKLITKRRIFCVAVIMAIIIVPFLYSYFYLGAFWDPYSKLEKLPVAVVNNDKGAEINKATRNLGEEFCDRLKEDASLKYVFTDSETARKGTEGDKYYAMIIIPEDFSADIASAGAQQKQSATIIYAPNEKKNFLSSQILARAVLEMEEKTRGSIDKEIVQGLTDQIKEVPIQLSELQDGLRKMDDGSLDLLEGMNTLTVGTNKLFEGSTTLADGVKVYYGKLGEYKDGVTSLKEGTKTLAVGVTDLKTGIGQLKGGVDLLAEKTKDIGQITTGAQTVAEGTKAFDTSLVQYTGGVNSLISSVSSTAGFLTQYVKANPSLMQDPIFAAFITKLAEPTATQNIQTLLAAGTQLTQAHTKLVTGTAQLQEGTATLTGLNTALVSLSKGSAKAQVGVSDLSEGAQKVDEGASALCTATDQLYESTGKINDGAESIRSGAAEVNNGAGDLYSGTKVLSDGLHTTKNGVDTAITDANNQIYSLEGMADYAAAPIKVEQKDVTTISNYGTAFAPYFMSLSLWVGALILFVGVYLDTEGKFKILSRESKHKMARSFIFLLIGLIQAVALAVVVKNGLGLKVENTLLFFASICLVSMVFISIVQFLMVHLKSAGKLLSVVLLILQLTSCGGTFPMETVPKIFNVLFPYMPMTYSVALFKQSITDTDGHEVLYNGGILIAILIVFMSLTIILSVFKNRRVVKGRVQMPVQFE
jgi:putative membrane protein